MLAFAQNQDILRIVMAKLPSPVGPSLVDLTGAVSQLWGSLFAPKVIDALGTSYTGTVLTF
jgi:hypothetical protein